MDHLSRDEFNLVFQLVHGKKMPGRPYQSPYDVSTIQNYEIGSKVYDGQRTLRYGQAARALGALARLVVNSNYVPDCPGHVGEDGWMGNLVATAAIGQKFVDINDTTLRAANYYQGGMMIAYGVLKFHQHLIVASGAGNGTSVRLYLDKPITTEAITVAMGVTAYLSPYSALTPPGVISQVGFEAFVGLPLVPVPQDSFCWIVTAGPCIITPTGGVWPGSAANLRDVYANPADGTINPSSVQDPTNGYQKVGYLLSATGGAAPGDWGDLWVMLQLDQ